MPPSSETTPDSFELAASVLLNHAPCGFLSCALDGTILQINDTFAALAARPRDEILASRPFADFLTTPGKIFYETHFGPLLHIKGSIREVALELARPPPLPPIPVLVNAVLRRNQSSEGGETAHILITVFDATDRRRYEHDLLQARRRAEAATAAEHAARALAEEAIRAKDEFLALITHELRTPLNAILGWTQILSLGGGLTEDQLEAVTTIDRNAHAQSNLINDLLDMSRISVGKMRLDVQQVALADVIRESLATARPAADAKGLRLSHVLDPALQISGDPGRLQQIFWNLLTNAIKFTPKGGFVRVTMGRVNSHVEIRVSDSGQGMSKDFLPHAFERFRQSASLQTQKTPGLGLGLAIVKNLVEMHGGSIEAQSEGEGRGSTFLINLPLAAVASHVPSNPAAPSHQPSTVLAPADTAQASTPSPHPGPVLPPSPSPSSTPGSLAGIQVLIVDDQPDAREFLRRLLARAGADVSQAGSAAAALDFLETHHPQVLISDIGMPGEDGYSLIRKVRMLGEGKNRIRAIALTAFNRPEDRTAALLAGFQMHLAKPVNAQELLLTVASLAQR